MDNNAPTFKPVNSPWVVAQITDPLIFDVSATESWLMNPPNRYVVCADHLERLCSRLSSWSDLRNCKFFNPLNGMDGSSNQRILIERHRERGIGDMLFVTGPVQYLYEKGLNTAKIFYYTNADKGMLLHGLPSLVNKTSLSGPIQYDSLPNYTGHWFIESATEYDSETDQLNVYDALYKQIGIDPATVPAKYKRPYISLIQDDQHSVDNFFKLLFIERKVDFRTTPYYVLSPTCNSSLRASNYTPWLELANELARQGFGVLIIGQVGNHIPSTDMPFSNFCEAVGQLSNSNARIINLLGKTPTRLSTALVGRSRGVVSLDSGMLYVAQGLRVPAISLWGTHHPGTRIGYDQEYMNLAVWVKQACPYSPCFTFDKFPADKCPHGAGQTICEPLRAVTLDDIMAKVELVESVHGSSLKRFKA